MPIREVGVKLGWRPAKLSDTWERRLAGPVGR